MSQQPDIQAVKDYCAEYGVDAILATHWANGSAGTEELADTIPMRRLGEPREVADTVYFLCTQPSAYISGTEIEINGAQHV